MSMTAMNKLKQKLLIIILSNNHSNEFELALESVIDDIDRNFIEIEKDQITDAYMMGSFDMARKEFKPEKYYNDTFKNK